MAPFPPADSVKMETEIDTIKEETEAVTEAANDVTPDLTTNVTICHDSDIGTNVSANNAEVNPVVEKSTKLDIVVENPTKPTQ